MAKIRKLRGAIYERFDSEAVFAKEIGWPRQRLNRITTGRKEPTVTEINELAAGLEISVEEVAGFFLPRKSPNEQQAIR